MGRKDEKTVMNTSVAEIFVRLIDEYIKAESGKRLIMTKKLTRASVISDAILLLLAQKGVLEQRLKSAGVSNEEAENIIAHLQAEYGIDLKASQLKE